MESDNIFSGILSLMMFSFASVIIITIGVLVLGSIYDYSFFEMDSFIQNNQDIMVNETATASTGLSNAIYNSITWIDKAWTVSAISFIIFLLLYSYQARRQNILSFSSFLYFGVALFTILLGIYLDLSDWFMQEILLNLLPTAQTILPNFTWWLDNAGMVSVLLMILMFFVNIVDFDTIRFNTRKEKESEEVL